MRMGRLFCIAIACAGCARRAPPTAPTIKLAPVALSGVTQDIKVYSGSAIVYSSEGNFVDSVEYSPGDKRIVIYGRTMWDTTTIYGDVVVVSEVHWTGK